MKATIVNAKTIDGANNKVDQTKSIDEEPELEDMYQLNHDVASSSLNPVIDSNMTSLLFELY